MTRFLAKTRVWLAIVLVIALVVPIGRWAADEFAFDAAGEEVVEELGDDADLARAMLLVRSVDCAGVTSTGSAFVVELDDRPTVVTNRHVVDEARSVSVRPLDGGDRVAVERHLLAPRADVAVLELAAPPAPDTALRTGSAVDADEEVRVVGFPSGRPSTGTGTVIEVGPARLVVDAPVSGGASGSPLLDKAGQVVGQVYGTTRDGHGVATPVAAVLEAVADAEEPAGC